MKVKNMAWNTGQYIRKLMGWCPNSSSQKFGQYVSSEKTGLENYNQVGGEKEKMKIRKMTLVIIVLVLFSFALSIYFYSRVPEQMATHWSSTGEVNGYMSKFWGLFFVPFMITGIAVLFLGIPFLEPQKENLEKFRKYYEIFAVLILTFMLVVHCEMLLWNTGLKISPNLLIPAGIGILFYYGGFLLEHAEKNYFIGIRTPGLLAVKKSGTKQTAWEENFSNLRESFPLLEAFFRTLPYISSSCLACLLQDLRLFTHICSTKKN